MRIIFTAEAPKPIGPFAQAVENNGLIFLSGQIAINSLTGELNGHDIRTQTKQVLENIIKVLSQADLSLQNIIKTTVFLQDMNDFQNMNEVYASYFKDHTPARSAIEVSRLPLNALVEIECVAVRKN